ncbi:hypothetical protein [Sporosarcina ureilytica]|uniref:Uncharacterized protein n=1 Tax=Sporosarcina ureilytica TaxID=298596 RepID=A0A1D8JI98_9BACL|nr:hypothetical protein [Sporosarcina ureilytica]AOV08442.1 hypothetical protein BI350_13460 [Sporosarcina ureilytica]
MTTENEPLLFVAGPPVFIRVAVTDEESTSVFVQNKEDYDHGKLKEVDQEKIEPTAEINPSIYNKIMYLRSGFQRQVYSPLKFIIKDETISGKIAKVDGDKVFIDIDQNDDQQVAVEISKIEEILWRGHPFQED